VKQHQDRRDFPVEPILARVVLPQIIRPRDAHRQFRLRLPVLLVPEGICSEIHTLSGLTDHEQAGRELSDTSNFPIAKAVSTAN
jgi:hypothetical protein